MNVWFPDGRSCEENRLPLLCPPEVVLEFQPPVEGMEVPPELRSGRRVGCGNESKAFFQYLQLCGCEGENSRKIGYI